MKTKFKLLVLIAASVLFAGVAAAQTVNMSGKWILTGIDLEEPGVARLTTSASGFQGIYTAGLNEDGYQCAIKDGKVRKSGRVAFILVCGGDEEETKLTGRIAKDGSVKGKNWELYS